MLKIADRFFAATLALLSLWLMVVYLAVLFAWANAHDSWCLAAIGTLAAMATALWSKYEQRIDSTRLLDSLLLVISTFIASMMIWYGLGKLIPPGQFSQPPLFEADKPYYQVKPFWIAWGFFSHSPLYNAAIALGELTAGILILFQRTRRLACCLLIPIIVNILLVNIAFDIGITSLAATLLTMDLYLLLHERRWLMSAFWSGAPVEPATSSVGRGGRLMAYAIAAAFAIHVYAITIIFPIAAPTPLQGVWTVRTNTSAHREWTRLYFDVDGEGHIRSGEDAQRVTFDVDAKRRHVTISEPEKGTKLFDGTYELHGSDLMLAAAGSARVTLRRVR